MFDHRNFYSLALALALLGSASTRAEHEGLEAESDEPIQLLIQAAEADGSSEDSIDRMRQALEAEARRGNLSPEAIDPLMKGLTPVLMRYSQQRQEGAQTTPPGATLSTAPAAAPRTIVTKIVISNPLAQSLGGNSSGRRAKVSSIPSPITPVAPALVKGETSPSFKAGSSAVADMQEMDSLLFNSKREGVKPGLVPRTRSSVSLSGESSGGSYANVQKSGVENAPLALDGTPLILPGAVETSESGASAESFELVYEEAEGEVVEGDEAVGFSALKAPRLKSGFHRALASLGEVRQVEAFTESTPIPWSWWFGLLALTVGISRVLRGPLQRLGSRLSRRK